MGSLVWLALSAAPTVKLIEVDSAASSGTMKNRFVAGASTTAVVAPVSRSPLRKGSINDCNNSFSDADGPGSRLRISLRAAFVASGSFQCLVGHGENEESLFFDLIEGAVSSLGKSSLETVLVKDGAWDAWSLETVPARMGMD